MRGTLTPPVVSSSTHRKSCQQVASAISALSLSTPPEGDPTRARFSGHGRHDIPKEVNLKALGQNEQPVALVLK